MVEEAEDDQDAELENAGGKSPSKRKSGLCSNFSRSMNGERFLNLNLVLAVENVRMRGRIFSEVVINRKKNEPLGLRIVGASADAEDADRSKIFIESIVPKSLCEFQADGVDYKTDFFHRSGQNGGISQRRRACVREWHHAGRKITG